MGGSVPLTPSHNRAMIPLTPLRSSCAQQANTSQHHTWLRAMPCTTSVSMCPTRDPCTGSPNSVSLTPEDACPRCPRNSTAFMVTAPARS